MLFPCFFRFCWLQEGCRRAAFCLLSFFSRVSLVLSRDGPDVNVVMQLFPKFCLPSCSVTCKGGDAHGPRVERVERVKRKRTRRRRWSCPQSPEPFVVGQCCSSSGPQARRTASVNNCAKDTMKTSQAQASRIFQRVHRQSQRAACCSPYC